ncbi:MAG: enoyl-CoA hydratase-related protein [Actinomycetota bacterium]|nr:enoyl-CoA hydratase-related protein [Actinomycetota bacterium]
MSEVGYAVEAGIATITLNRPDARNRLTAEGMAQLMSAFATAADDPAARLVVLTGSGNTFCSGADLSAATGEGFAGAGPSALVDLLAAMLDHPKPLIAKVQGHVAGGGNGLVAACDLAVASADARFAFSEVRVGVAPAVISVVCLAVMHRRAAQELLLTGERVDADRVLEAGLLTSVVPAVGLDAAVQGLAEQLMAGGPEALAHTKELLRRVPRLARDEAFAFTAEMSAERFSSAEAQEGMTAFLEKRPAAWLTGS